MLVFQLSEECTETFSPADRAEVRSNMETLLKYQSQLNCPYIGEGAFPLQSATQNMLLREKCDFFFFIKTTLLFYRLFKMTHPCAVYLIIFSKSLQLRP